MIFCTIGNDRHKFPRFIKIIEEINDFYNDDIFLQHGYSLPPKEGIISCQFLKREKFENKIQQAKYIISHGGAGTIAYCLQNKKIPIVIPRLKKYNEHLDNHQLDIASHFAKEGLCIVEHNADRIIKLLKEKELTIKFSLQSRKKEFFESLRSDLLNLL